MALCRIFEGRGVTGAQYHRVREEVAGDRPPPGSVYHMAGPTEDGWCVVEVRESREALQRFMDEKLRRALDRAGIAGQPRIFDAANIMQA